MNINSDSTSSSLIRSVKRNDQDGWNKLAKLYGPLVYSWVRKVGVSEEDAVDIGQEVFRVVSQKVPTFDLERTDGGFRAWLRQITRNKIGDRIRQINKQEVAFGGSDNAIGELATFDWASRFDDDSAQEDNSELLSAMLRSIQTGFKEKTWQAFWLTAIDEQPVSIVSDQLQMTQKAIRQAKYRVLKKLRDEFGDLLD